MASSENTAINELIARVSGGQTSASARMAAAVPPLEATGGAEPRVSSSLPLPAEPAFPVGGPPMRPPTPPLLPSQPYPTGMQVHAMPGPGAPGGWQDHPIHTTFPVTMPVAAPFEAQPSGSPAAYPMVPQGMFNPAAPAGGGPAPMVGPPGMAYGDPAAAQSWRSPTAGTEWIEPTQLVNPRHRERFVGTLKLRHSDLRMTIGKLALTMVLLMGAGIFIGSYVVFSGEAGVPSNQAVAANVAEAPAANAAFHIAEPLEPAPTLATPEPAPTANAKPAPVAGIAPASAATTEPAAEPTAAGKPEPTAAVGKPELAAAGKPEPAAVVGKPEPAPAAPNLSSNAATPSGGEPPAPLDTAAKAAMLVDVRIDSTPSGATVTLVDRGKSQFVGKTPVNATLDTSREYDLVFTFPNKATQQKHLNASTTRRIAVTLPEQPEQVKAQPVPAGAPAGAPATVPPHIEKAIVEKAPASPVRKASAEPGPASAVKKPGKAAGEPALGEGTLMVSSKPPCQIVIDGKPTGLTTPQRSITLSAGNHKVTLINSEKDIKKTVSVQITANSTEKLIEDLMP